LKYFKKRNNKKMKTIFFSTLFIIGILIPFVYADTTCIACGLILTLLSQPPNGTLPTGPSPDITCVSLGLCDGTCPLYNNVTGNWPVASPIGISNGGVDDQRRMLRTREMLPSVLPSLDDAIAFLRAFSVSEASTKLDFYNLWMLIMTFLARGHGAAKHIETAITESRKLTSAPDSHKPIFDNDNDGYGADSYGFRGASWRGKDCNDSAANIYPTRLVNAYGPNVDHNCNGIVGGNATIPDFEAAFCSGENQPMGVVILGDSAAAHFAIPPQLVNAREVNAGSLSNLSLILDLLGNEADWPQCSWATGFRATEECPFARNQTMRSIYKKMRDSNLCNHRGFLNLGVNGARTTSMAPPGVINSFTPNPAADTPQLVIYALIGNDVCNGHPGDGSMTTVDEFFQAVNASLVYLDSVLTKGSHVAFLGLVDGRVLWDTTSSQIHPIGVSYPAIYEYLSCNSATPCWGWLNSNETWRNFTSERAQNLTNVYDTIISTQTYKNFDMYRLNVDFVALLADYVKAGGRAIDCIEAVDGFHPSQVAQSLLADVAWADLQKNKPDWLPRNNTYNAAIAQIFGANLNGY
jgi:acyloxyacyl hydrolase